MNYYYTAIGISDIGGFVRGWVPRHGWSSSIRCVQLNILQNQN